MLLKVPGRIGHMINVVRNFEAFNCQLHSATRCCSGYITFRQLDGGSVGSLVLIGLISIIRCHRGTAQPYRSHDERDDIAVRGFEDDRVVATVAVKT